MTGFLLTLLRLSLLGSVLGVILMGALRLLGRRISRAAGYYLWLLVLLRLCVPLWVDLPIPAQPQSAAVVGTMVMTGQNAAALPAQPPADQGGQAAAPVQPATPAGGGETAAANVPTVDLWDVLTSPALWFGLWAVGFVLSLGRYGRSYRRFARLVRRESHAPGRLALEVLKELDPGGKIALAVCPAIPCPMALGLLRPTVFLPEGVEDRGRLEDILRHELTHLRRRDLLYKWCAAVVTSLHWFNPLMPVFRREMARRCELACDEAAAGKLSPAARRRYGETLLSLAADPPKGLVVTTLCEEKEHLKERLVDLVNGSKKGPAALALTLCLTALLGSCAMIGGTAMVTPDAETSAPAETQAPAPAPTAAPDALFTDAALYDLGGGLTLAIPADIAEDVMVLFDEDLGDGSEPVFPRVYHRSSYEAGMKDFDAPMGFLFSLFRYDPMEYEQHYLAVDGGVGQTVFARDRVWYYGMGEPTDVQFYASGGEIDTDSPDYRSWEDVLSRIPDIQADFMARNGLAPYDGGADLDRPFLWTGEHRYVEVHSADYAVSLTLLLSQPAAQGSGGIWCVEGSFDNNYGGWSKELPYGIEVTAAEYYADLQAQVDAGHRPGLLDPVQAAREWYQEEYDTDTQEGLAFTLLEGEPAGDLWATLRRVTGQDGSVESLFYLDGAPSTSRGSRGYMERGRLSGELTPRLYPFVWVEAQGPEVIQGEAVRYRAESGDELLFLEEDGLLRITIGSEVFWYRPAYAYRESPYDKLLDYWESLGGEDPFAQEQIDAGMDALRAWLEAVGWETPLEGSLRYMPNYARYHAQVYLESGNGQGSGLGRADVLVLYAAFSDAPKGAGDYIFWLIPDGSGGWQVDDWGRTVFPDVVP